MIKKDKVLLPNLYYDKSKDAICFKFKNSFYLKVNDKQVLFNNYVLNNVSYTGSIYYYDLKIKCTLIKKEDINGLYVDLEYDQTDYLSTNEISKVGKEIESLILNIDNYENKSDKNSSSEIDEENDNLYYGKGDISDSSIDESNNYNNTDQSHDIYLERDDSIQNSYTFSKFNTT
jgi:hypothetical protein